MSSFLARGNYIDDELSSGRRNEMNEKLQAAIAKSEDIDSRSEDSLVNPTTISVIPRESGHKLDIEFGGRRVAVTHERMLRAVSGHAEVPFAYLEKLLNRDPELAARNLESGFRERVSDTLVRIYTDSSGEETLRGIRTETYLPISSTLVLRRVDELFGNDGGVSIEHVALDQFGMRVTGRTKRDGTETVGSLFPGFAVGNDETGGMALEASIRLFRLACTNGLVLPAGEGFGYRKVHAGKSSQQEIVERLFGVGTFDFGNQLKNAMPRIDRALKCKVDFNSFAHGVRRRGMVTSDELGQWVDAYDHEVSEGVGRPMEALQNTLWGSVNGLTRTARDTRDYGRAAVLERTAGALLSLSDRQVETMASLGRAYIHEVQTAGGKRAENLRLALSTGLN